MCEARYILVNGNLERCKSGRRKGPRVRTTGAWKSEQARVSEQADWKMCAEGE